MTCLCGQDAHPLYNGRCEDCWANAQGGPGTHRMKLLEIASEQIEHAKAKQIAAGPIFDMAFKRQDEQRAKD